MGVETVARAAERLAAALADVPSLAVGQRSGVWSAQRYVWHVVDALRSGTERLRTLALDPDAGGVPWDADLAMAVRARSPHSVGVGLHEVLITARQWERAAVEAPGDVTTDHPDFGAMDRLLLVRPNAHEVVHHAFVIGRLVAQAEPPAPVEPRQ